MRSPALLSFCPLQLLIHRLHRDSKLKTNVAKRCPPQKRKTKTEKPWTLTSVAHLLGIILQTKGTICSEGTCLSCSLVPSWGMYERQLINVSLSHRCFSPSLSPSVPLSLKTINKILKKNLGIFCHNFHSVIKW